MYNTYYVLTSWEVRNLILKVLSPLIEQHFPSKCFQGQPSDVGHLCGKADRDEPRPCGSGLEWGPTQGPWPGKGRAAS